MKLPNYAIFDLTTGKMEHYPISRALYETYLGGKTMGARLLTDLTPPGLDPFSPESVVIINTGPMNGTGAPSSSRFNMTFKNVLTGGIGTSNCGGQFGVMLKRAGFDGIILKGCAQEPTTIEIVDGAISAKPCPELWGLDAEKTQEALPKPYGKLVIGPAGENLVRYSCAVSGERVAGRCGAGAVLGAKKVKALIAYGTATVAIADPEGFDNYIKKWVKFLKGHPMTGDTLPHYGSAGLVNKANASHALPTRNFQKGVYDKAEDICGETLAEKHLTRNSGCVSCPIRCERRVMVHNKEVKGPEFETVGLFGSNIENNNLEFINTLNYHADLLGMDTISLGGTLAFAMELQEKGMADFGLEFGNIDNILEIVEKIARREGIYSELADGSKLLSEKYGGKDFAIHAKGVELASYEPRGSTGMGLGYATSNRGGCHLNGGYLALMESVGVINMDAQTPKGKPELTVLLQNAIDATSAAGFCLFSLQTMIPAVLFKTGPASGVNKFAGTAMLGSRALLGKMWSITPAGVPINSMFLFPHSKTIELATGLKMTTGRFLNIGERGYNLERLYNLREGLTSEDDTLPDRLTKVPQRKGRPDTVVNLDAMLPVYYKVRGWDKNGVPTPKKLQKLGLL
ncbi:MAG: aldehyde ferredoxin oxidoreductase family protein [Oscillospiraceae bacterium]